MPTYEVAGLKPRIELPVPLIVRLIPKGQTNQRPGIARNTPGLWVQHETANTAPGADAEMHMRWLHNGAGGQQLSFHFAVDDGVIYQMIPIDEVTWQAADGAGPGNMSGISCELCVNQGIDHAKARANAEALAGGVLKALGMSSDTLRQHNYFSGKDCPTLIRRDKYWPTFVANVGKIIGSVGPIPAPSYVEPGPIPTITNNDVVLNSVRFWACERAVQAKEGARFYRFADPASGETRAPARANESFMVQWAVQDTKGAWWWVTTRGSRIRQADTATKATFAI